MSDVLKEFISEIIFEKRVREADISDGSRVPHGSSAHIKDLKGRIQDLERWRARQKRGSEARANYSRLISKLKSELSSAIRVSKKTAAKKSTVKVVQEGLTREEAQEYIQLSDQINQERAKPNEFTYAEREDANKNLSSLIKRKNMLIAKAGAKSLAHMDNIVLSLLQ
jgi:hypothetical protein